MKVREIMTSEGLATATLDTTLAEIAERMRDVQAVEHAEAQPRARTGQQSPQPRDRFRDAIGATGVEREIVLRECEVDPL